MDFLFDAFNNWMRSFLTDGIKGQLSGILTTLNVKVGSLSAEISQTPQGWNVNVFSMIKTLCQNVIMPIAGIVLTFVACYELIAMVVDRNSFHDIETAIFFKWIFKTAIAVFLVSHTFDIIMSIFDIAQYLIQQSAGFINTEANMRLVFASLDDQLSGMSIGQLMGLAFELIPLHLGIHLLDAAVFLIIYGRMLEIYLYCSVGPIPMATMMNHEWGDIGKNYLRSLAALGLQGFLMMVCVGIYAALIQSVTFGGDISASVWAAFGYTALLCFALFKTSSLAKSVCNAH